MSKSFSKVPTVKNDSVQFTTKGQVVIPARIRRKFHIETGTRAIVQSTPEGILKRKPGAKPLAQERAEYKAEEKTLEEAKYERSTRGSR